MPLQKEGVVLAAEGADKFVADLRKSSSAFDKFIGGLEKGEAKSGRMGSGLLNMGKAAGLAKGALGAIGGTALAAGAALGGVALGIGFLTKKLADLAKQTAPIEGLAAQFDNLTSSIEGGTQEMLTALRRGSSGMIANRDLMRSFNDAASLVNIQFAQKLPDAMNLLGKVSAATGTDMNYLLNSLVVGVGRVSPMILDNLKIQVSVAEATAKASEMFGKEADALSKVEQQTALTELALAKLEEKFGALPDVGQTAQAQMAMLGATFQNIKDTLGQFLLPAFSSFLQGVNALANSFQAAISEGGAFYPLLVNLGAILSIVGDGFKELADRVSRWLGNMSQDWSSSLGQMVADAVQWGAELVSGFATGIIDAANTVLVEAMNVIQNILTSWLLGASPPKVAPGIEGWGKSLFESYLKGMTEADFGVLESIQGPLKKILEGPAFADISKAIAGALAGGDRAGALEILAKSSKTFGADIAELARREFALADAVQAVEQAEKRLAEAQENAIRSQRQIGIETQKYNELLRSGASEDALGTQLARINAAEKEAQAARDEQKAAETGIEGAKSRVDTLKEQVDWQRRFLDQLFGISDALSEEEKAQARIDARARAKKGKVGVTVPGAPEGGMVGGLGAGIGGRIAAAIEAAKGKIGEALGGLWGIIQTELITKWNDAIGELGKTWDTFKDTVGQAWDSLKEKYPFLQTVEDWIVGLPEKIKTMITEGWDKFKEVMDAVWSFIETYLAPVIKDLTELGFILLRAAVNDVWDAIEKNLLPILDTIWKFITETLIPLAIEPLVKALTWLKDEVIEKLAQAFEWLKKALKDAHTWLGNLLDKMKESNIGSIKDFIKIWRGGSPSIMAIGIQTAADAMERMANVSIPKMNAAFAMQPVGAGGRFYQPPGAIYNSRTANNTFNTTVNSGMDAAALIATIRRVLRQELQ